MEFQGTKGEWKVVGVDYPTIECYFNTENSDAINTNPTVATIGSAFRSREETQANAKLIADAGTTASKCGLLPSTLLEQRDKLLDALQQMQIDLNILQSNFRQIEKVDSRAEGMVEVIQNWIDRNHKAIEEITSENQINSHSND